MKEADSFVIPPDINGLKTIIPPLLSLTKSLRVAIYIDAGAAESGIEHVCTALATYPSISVTPISSMEIQSGALSLFDAVIFAGGAGHLQAESLQTAGVVAVREYVRNGGGYLGICAGAHLAAKGHPWSLGIINAEKIVADEWKRGRTFVDIELTDEGRILFGNVHDLFKCRYANGIIFKDAQDSSLPPFTTAAYFRSEVSDNNTTPGVMINTPAIIYAPYNKGKVLLISPHPENTPGLENTVARALVFLTN